MNSLRPVALVVGVNRFGARKLVEELVRNDITVLGVGEYVAGLEGQNSFEYITNLSQVTSVDYVFDFDGKIEVWEEARRWGAKLAVVEINGYEGEDKSWLVSGGVDWRLVRAYGVYGDGMLREKEVRVGVENLVPIMLSAIKNQNLEMPKEGGMRVLAEADMVDVILRSIFLSGTSGQIIDVWGEETRFVDMAESLVDGAKMTRKKILEKELAEREVDEKEIWKNWEKIRWQPRVKFKEAIEETLQYFFRVVDEENRRGKITNNQKTSSKQVPNNNNQVPNINKRFEVVVETPINDNREPIKVEEKLNDDLRSKKYDVRIEPETKTINDKRAPIYVEEKSDDDLRSEEKVEIRPMMAKSPIPERPVKEQTPLVRQGGRSPLDKGDRAHVSEVAVAKKIFKLPKIGFNFNFVGKKWGWGVGAIMSVVLVLVGTAIYGQYSLIKQTLKVKDLVVARKYKEAGVLIEKVETKLNKNEMTVTNLGLAGTTWGKRYLAVVRVWSEGLDLGKEVVGLAQRAENIADGTLKEKEINWNKEFEALNVGLVAVEEKSGVLQARMMGGWSWIPARWRGQWQDWVESVGESRASVSLAAKLAEVIPKIIGVGEKRKEYLVLLQNENEIRPNGGFIGSYGILSFDGGKLINFEVKDVYETDGQLKGHVEPPAPIRKYLGEGGWFLRDANWSADFNQSGKDIQWFFEKETGRKMDGVVGINLSLAKAILGVIGEVYVPDFKEKINSTNLYEQAEYYSETKNFPGSTQKASFLGGLAKQLFEEIKTMSPDKRLKMMTVMMEMLERNEIQLAINDKTVAEKLARAGWDGGVYRGKCAQSRCFADYLYVLEANLGVNKANFFLYRAMELAVDISNNAISRVLRINYENTAKSNAWPGGDYKNYLRVYLPMTANLAEVSITADNGAKTVVGGTDLDVNQVLGKKEVGFLVMVPTAKKRQVEIRYTDAVDLSKSDKFSYLNYIQRQSGFGDTGLVNLVSVPDGWQVTQVEPEASLVKGKVLFNQKLIKDIKLGVEISK